MSYTTNASLLMALRNGEDLPWSDFYDTYRPLMVLCGGDYHLSPHEIDELCQQVMLDIFKNHKTFQYDPQKGRFRDYLRQVIRRNAIDLLRRRGDKQSQAIIEDSSLAEDPMAAKWESEWREHVLNQALMQLRQSIQPKTYQAFELYALKGEPAKTVAQFLDISVGQVYLAKHRATATLRQLIEQLQKL
jgi:RNA polymerase sigma factor (sigma-70 family)